MNIGQAAQASGLSSKAIRYYEDLGLVVPARDQNNDYRVYSSADVDRLRFLQRARAVGLSLDECSELLAIYTDSGRRCGQVKALVMDKIAQVDQQLSALSALRETLSGMADECTGDNLHGHAPANPQFPVVDTSAGKPVAMAFTLVDDTDAS